MIKSNFKPTCLAINMGAVMNSIRNGLLGNAYSLFQCQGPVTVLWTVSGPTGTTEYLFTLDHLVLSSASADQSVDFNDSFTHFVSSHTPL